MEFKPERPQNKSEEVDLGADKAVKDLMESVSTSHAASSYKDRKEAWDKKKEEKSKKFDSANVEQMEMFKDDE